MPTKQFSFVPDWKVLGWMKEREKETGQSVSSQIKAGMRCYKKIVEDAGIELPRPERNPPKTDGQGESL